MVLLSSLEPVETCLAKKMEKSKESFFPQPKKKHLATKEVKAKEGKPKVADRV